MNLKSRVPTLPRNPPAAKRLRERVKDAVNLLAEMPTIGRKGRVTGTYEKIASDSPYILAYEYDEKTLHILRVIHMSRDWPFEGWP